MWSDAYHALSASKDVRILGYSLPPDDIEYERCSGLGSPADSGRAESQS